MRLARVEEEVMKRAKPLIFRPHHPENCVLRAETDFAKTCAVLRDNHVDRPEALPVFDFETQLEYLKEKFKPGGVPPAKAAPESPGREPKPRNDANS